MLMAGLKAMNADQKAWVMQGCEHWWLAYADGTLADAKYGIDAFTSQNETESLHLDALQSAVLLEEAAPSLLAAQLRSQEEGFGTACSHAQQILFATTCLNEARLDCIDEGAELLSFAVQRWTDQHAPVAQFD